MEGQVFDYLPMEMINRVRNLNTFAGILVLDKWTGNADGRQAAFWRKSRERKYTAAFIDHYEWNFGDGSAVQSTSSGTNSHVYTTAGPFNIVVNVVPQFGNAISVPIAIIVS